MPDINGIYAELVVPVVIGERLLGVLNFESRQPIMPEEVEEAAWRDVDLTAIPTEDACRLIASLDGREVHAVLLERRHVF